MLFRHIRPDGDCVGASRGLKTILQLSFPEKEVLIPDTQHSDFLEFLGPDDGQIPMEQYADALGIVLDTASENRISNKKYTLCKELIKIDHHIPLENYGDYIWVEEERSSCCEMVVVFYETFRDELVLDKEGATYIYTGMVTDSGRFRYDSVTPQTFRCAAFLMEQGFRTDDIYRNLYADDFSFIQLRARYVLKIQLTDCNVAYIYTTKEEAASYGADNFTLSRGMVNVMSEIRGIDTWVNFTETEGGVLCEIRSNKYNINPIAVKYGGGGHQKASGCTLKDQGEAMSLLADLNALAEVEAHE